MLDLWITLEELLAVGVLLRVGLRERLPRLDRGQFREALGKDPPRTRAIATMEAADVQTDLNGPTAPGKIDERSLVMTVDSRRFLVAPRTGRRPTIRGKHER